MIDPADIAIPDWQAVAEASDQRLKEWQRHAQRLLIICIALSITLIASLMR